MFENWLEEYYGVKASDLTTKEFDEFYQEFIEASNLE